jgi:hypothetical protein
MRKVGLFVGIGQYADEEITPLFGAANDATELAALFKRNLGFETHVVTHDKLLAGEESLKHKVVELTKPLGADDLFVFYFAGHGLRHQTDPARPQQLFLLPNAELTKVHAGKLDVGVITLQFLKDYTDREGLRRAFVFDVCRDELRVDKAHTRAVASDFAFDGEVVFRNLVLGRSATGGGASPPAILNSCCDAQRAVELRGKGRGLFSLALDDLIGERVRHSQPVVLNASLVDELTARMRVLWPAAERIDLRPCLVAKSEVRLFEPPSAADGREARLLELFDEQLAKGQLNAPAGRCARDTLNQLVLLGTATEAVLEDLSQRLQAAFDRLHDGKLTGGAATSAAKQLNRTLSSRPRSVIACLGLTAAFWLCLAVLATSMRVPRMFFDSNEYSGLFSQSVLDQAALMAALCFYLVPLVGVPGIAVWAGRTGSPGFFTSAQVFSSCALSFFLYFVSEAWVSTNTQKPIYFALSMASLTGTFVPILIWRSDARKWFADVAAARAVVKREAESRRSVETP